MDTYQSESLVESTCALQASLCPSLNAAPTVQDVLPAHPLQDRRWEDHSPHGQGEAVPLPPHRLALLRQQLEITPLHPSARLGSACAYYDSMQDLVCETLSPVLSDEMLRAPSETLFSYLRGVLPVITWSQPENLPCVVSIRMIISSPGNISNGTGRFFLDNVDRWVFPGSNPGIITTRSADFLFAADPSIPYFLYEVAAVVTGPTELSVLQKNMPKLATEMRVIMQAVFSSRRIVAMHQLSLEEKSALVQESIESLLQRPKKEFDINVFDQMQHLFARLCAERNTSQMVRAILPLAKFSPPLFDRDIFHEIQKFVLLFRDSFTAARTVQHLSRIVCFQYLFTKRLKADLQQGPSQRYFYMKIGRTAIWKDQRTAPVLGIAVALNLFGSNEVFEQSHIATAVTALLPHVVEVPDSFVEELRERQIRLCYMEFQRRDGLRFSNEEVQLLKKQLGRNLKHSVQSLVHSLFIPRNEEEIMRKILTLSHELRQSHDIPQVMISFSNQSDSSVSFTIVLARAAKPGAPSIEELCNSNSSVSFTHWERRCTGYLRSRRKRSRRGNNDPKKEAYIFTATLDKDRFLRNDHSLDLNRARQEVFSQLHHLLGDIRDYNGGIIVKQQENLERLKELLGEVAQKQQFLLENFFYSLQPTIQQSLISPEWLHLLFSLLLQTLEEEPSQQPQFRQLDSSGQPLFAIVATQGSEWNQRLSIICHQLLAPVGATYSIVSHFGVTCCALLFPEPNPQQRHQLLERLSALLT